MALRCAYVYGNEQWTLRGIGIGDVLPWISYFHGGPERIKD
jgi:hypothetical protein